MATQSAPAFVVSRRIGDASVSIISDGTFVAPLLSWLLAPEAEARGALPGANANGEVTIGMNAALVRIGDASILIDPGWGAFDSDSRTVSWYVQDLQARRSPGVFAGLASLGIQPEQITHVLLTHAHEDHFLGVTLQRDGKIVACYPQARHLLGRAEWEGNPERANPSSDAAIHLGAIDDLGLLDLVDGDHVVAPGVTMIHAPGESPGHYVVHVQSAGESFYYLGDLFHHTCEVEHVDWFSEWHDQAAMRLSRQRLLAEAVRSQATVVFTHGHFPAWGHIVPSDTGYRWVNA